MHSRLTAEHRVVRLDQLMLMETAVMDETKDDYQPSQGLLYAIAGVSVFVVGGLILANSHDEDPLFLLGLALEGTGIYLLLAGAVARGIQMARGQSVKHR